MRKKCESISIMQPTYLPWLGYFDLINSVDCFVFLDDVQFARRSWQQRNKILLNGAEHTLTVPVFSKGKRDQLINEVIINDEGGWRKKHSDTLVSAYQKANKNRMLLYKILDVINSDEVRLSKLNQSIIEIIIRHIGITTDLLTSSEIGCVGSSSNKLFNICKAIGGKIYVSAAGSKGYIEREKVFEKNNMQVRYHDYVCKKYSQKGSSSYIPQMSAIDFLFNSNMQDIRSAFKY